MLAIYFPSNVSQQHLSPSDHDNKLTGPDAVKFFERSQLPRPVLAKVWALADNARKGYLDQSTFAKVTTLAACTCAKPHLAMLQYLAWLTVTCPLKLIVHMRTAQTPLSSLLHAQVPPAYAACSKLIEIWKIDWLADSSAAMAGCQFEPVLRMHAYLPPA